MVNCKLCRKEAGTTYGCKLCNILGAIIQMFCWYDDAQLANAVRKHIRRMN